MLRSKKIVLLSHCLMNVNSKVEGLAVYEAALKELLLVLIDKGYGIYQLPCPEVRLYGIKRWGQSVEQYSNMFYEKYCRNLAQDICMEVMEYQRCGYTVNTMIGLDGSPTCGITKTFTGDWGGLDHNVEGSVGPGEGVFVCCLREESERHGLKMNFVGLDEHDPLSSIQNIIDLMEFNGEV